MTLVPQQLHTADFIHPELSKGEVFFTNSDSKSFEGMELKTKRKGTQTFDGEGNQIFYEDWFPVFLRQSEIVGLNKSLQKIRREFRARRS